MDKSKALTCFSALAQPTRLDVFRLLIRSGGEGLQAGEIGTALGVRQNTMSANLAVLSNANLVTTRREGRVIRYFADLATLREMLSFLMEDCCGGSPEQCAPLLDELTCEAG